MRFTFLCTILATLFLSGCAIPANMYPKATTIENYCEGAARSAATWATSYRDHRDDFDYAKGAILFESARFHDPSQKQERIKMVDILTYVYQHPSEPPEKLHDAIYTTCMKERVAGTWFHN